MSTNRKYKSKFLSRLIGITLLLAFLIFFFVPFTTHRKNSLRLEGICKYRFAVYEFYFIEAEGEGYESNVLFFQIFLTKKIGGPLEYFGLKKIDGYEEWDSNQRK
jgi:hypothetical protein